jgi:hypothetical protein
VIFQPKGEFMTKQPETNHHPIGLDGRTRDQDGEIRHKRGDTQVRTLREEYGETFAEGHRDDDTLADVLEKDGSQSLSQYLKKH